MSDANVADAGQQAAIHALLGRYERGEASAEITLMQLLLLLKRTAPVWELLAARASSSAAMARLAGLLRDHATGCDHVAEMLGWLTQASESRGAPAIARWRSFFDRGAEHSEEASVALYSLGSPQLLAKATREIIALLEGWELLSARPRVLDFGCGIGRVAAGLAPYVAFVHGLDISERMLAAAQRRCAKLANVSFARTSGTDLRACATESQDLVLAVDSFPFVVSAGELVIEVLFAEFARVLRPGGELVMLNYSYGRDLSRDCEDVRALAASHGFRVLVQAAQPFRLWDAAAFRLRRISDVS
jgi:SAM-dependent methyltransferase